MRQITFPSDFESWRQAARALLIERVPPAEVCLRDSDQGDMAGVAESGTGECNAEGRGPQFFVPRQFVEIARYVSCHNNSGRWQLLYSVLWRLQQDRNLLRLEDDHEVKGLLLLEQQVRRDVYKLQAYARFYSIHADGQEHLIAWHCPEYRSLELAVPQFLKRYETMHWSLLTPFRSVHWEPQTRKLQFGDGIPRFTPPEKDELKELWLSYYGAVFNPARVKIKSVRTQLPTRPRVAIAEAAELSQPLQEAPMRPERAKAPKQQPSSAAAFVPNSLELTVLRESIKNCQGCALHECATQAVFGAGPGKARMVLVGEQPGNDEDLAGQPFVGPAGQLLDRALAEAGIERGAVYITNAVKHFKFERHGSRRIHRTPQMQEIAACKPWLEAELKAINPELIVCLGATAAKSLLGAQFQLMRERGKFLSSPLAAKIVATVHPSAILRGHDPMRSEELFQMLCQDLRLAKEMILLVSA